MMKKHIILMAMTVAVVSLVFANYGIAEPLEGAAKHRPAYYTSPSAAKALKVSDADRAKAVAESFLIVKTLKRPAPDFQADFPKRVKFNDKFFQDWKKMCGYDAPSLIALNDPAPEIKSGTVITPMNYREFPNLYKILPESQLWRLTSLGHPQLKKIEVESTTPIYFHTKIVEESYKNDGKISVDPNTRQLLGGYHIGLPFLNPKTGLEHEWNSIMAKIHFQDEFSFQTINYLNFDSKGNPERTIRCNLYWTRFLGRSHSKFDADYYYEGAEQEKKDGVLEKGSMVVVHPADIKGFAFVRTRYMDPERPDYFIAYIPGMRRVRVLSGTDAQDPIFGTELQWDTWATDWQKISGTIYPTDYNILGEGVLLYPSYMPAPSVRVEGNVMYTRWQKRPVTVLEYVSKDPRYYYGYRVKYIDMETKRDALMEYYDTKGNLWRTWTGFRYHYPDTAVTCWEGCDIPDYINRHHTILKMESRANDPAITPAYFDLRFLSRQAR
jgi:hypothetical protein